MWTAGVIFYTLVCRQLPFQSKDRKATFELIKNEEPDYKNDCFKRFRPEAQDLMKKMLTKDP